MYGRVVQILGAGDSAKDKGLTSKNNIYIVIGF